MTYTVQKLKVFTSGRTDSLTVYASFVDTWTKQKNITLRWHISNESTMECQRQRCFWNYKTPAENVKFWCQSLIRENKAAVPRLPDKQWREIMITEKDVNLSAISGLLYENWIPMSSSAFKWNGICHRDRWNWLLRTHEGRRRYKQALSPFSSYSGCKTSCKTLTSRQQSSLH